VSTGESSPLRSACSRTPSSNDPNMSRSVRSRPSPTANEPVCGAQRTPDADAPGTDDVRCGHPIITAGSAREPPERVSAAANPPVEQRRPLSPRSRNWSTVWTGFRAGAASSRHAMLDLPAAADVGRDGLAGTADGCVTTARRLRRHPAAPRRAKIAVGIEGSWVTSPPSKPGPGTCGSCEACPARRTCRFRTRPVVKGDL